LAALREGGKDDGRRTGGGCFLLFLLVCIVCPWVGAFAVIGIWARPNFRGLTALLLRRVGVGSSGAPLAWAGSSPLGLRLSVAVIVFAGAGRARRVIFLTFRGNLAARCAAGHRRAASRGLGACTPVFAYGPVFFFMRMTGHRLWCPASVSLACPDPWRTPLADGQKRPFANDEER